MIRQTHQQGYSCRPSLAVCVINEHGKIVKEAEVPSDPETIASYSRGLDGSVAIIGLEAGPLSQWLHRGLSAAGLDVVLMETRQVKGALKAMPIKTDRRMRKGSPVSCIWAGSGRCTANPSQTRRCVRFSTRTIYPAEYDCAGDVAARRVAELQPEGRCDLARAL